MAIDQLIETAQKQAFEALTAAQDQVLAANRQAAGALGTVLDKLPLTGFAKDAFGPGALDKSFAFAGQLLEANRRFASELVGAWTGQSAAKPAAK